MFEIQTGTTPSTSQNDYWEGGDINWITPADMRGLDHNIKIIRSENKITEKALNETNLTLMPKNSIIISTRAPVGYVGLVDTETTFNQGCKGLIPKDYDKTDPTFYCYFLLSKRKELENASGGSTFKELSKYSLENFELIEPPFTEQKAIASVLSTVDSAIQKSDEALEKTERLKQGLMQRLLTKGIGHTEYKYSEELGCEIPKEWEVVKIEDIAETSSGGTPSRDKKEYYGGKIPWVKSGELREKIIYDVEEKITESGLKNSSAKMFPKGTLLIAMYGATVGKTGVLGIDATTNQAVCAILPKRNDLDINYLWYSLRFRKSLLNSSSSGGAQPNISQEIIRFFRIPLPQLIEQKQISEILLTIDQKLELEMARKEIFERIKKGLMDVLLSGKKRVIIN